ncbi:MAG: 23S rRNA (adenine(2503)-C(2))-methyltransferase RlmN [Myxococcota bacterium]
MAALYAMTLAELAESLGGEGRAQAVMALLREGKDPWTSLPPGASRRLKAAAGHTVLEQRLETVASDGTRKLLVGLLDGRSIEMVLIPSPRRTTLCISSQVGCVRACSFCSTGTMGLLRNLEADEIVGQVVLGIQLAKQHGLPPLSNLVLMGMGEPLDNLAAVKQALAVIVGPSQLGIGRRHVTLSTVGPSAAAVKKAGALEVPLAWSLHAAEESLRRRLIPTARASVEGLRDAFAEILGPRGDPLFVEMTLIEGLNDGPEQADAVFALFSGFPTEVRVNLLPMNAVPGAAMVASSEARVRAFKARLESHGLRALIRRARGAEEHAACGQLVSGR